MKKTPRESYSILRPSRRLLKGLVEQLLAIPGHGLPDRQQTGLKRHRVDLCDEIDQEKATGHISLEKARYMAHVGHKPMTVCVGTLFGDLPLQSRLGILAHEIGHLIATDPGDDAADMEIYRRFGLEIKYGGDLELQYIDPFDPFYRYFALGNY